MIELTKTLLKSIPIFSKLEEDELSFLKTISKIKNFKNKNIVFYEGDDSINLHILLDGIVEIFKTDAKAKEIPLKQFLPYNFIAEVSNYNHIEFPASAKSVGNSSVLVINYTKFEERLLFHPTIAPMVLKSISNKVLVLEKLISENLTMNATQRVAKFIYENEDLFLNQKHNTLANRLNITPVTFSRILKKFKLEAIISSNNHILDKNLLKKEFS